jgi:hypothetical protein
MFARDRRRAVRLIVNADDFGSSVPVNVGGACRAALEERGVRLINYAAL